MKISIITPSYNQGHFIKDNIESVLNQNYPNFEHIIIDGGSTDNTLSILKEFKHLKWISEKDKGPVDALHKGFKMAKGEIVTWVNADDYLEKNIFKDIINVFESTKSRIVIGDMVLIDLVGNVLQYNDFKDIYNKEYLLRIDPDIVKQPSTFFTRDLFYEVGGFDESLKMPWDYDLFLKMFTVTKPVIINKLFSYQRIYDSTLTRNNLRKQAAEIFKVSRRHGAKLTDKINRMIIKRYLFPTMYTSKGSITMTLYYFFKNKLFKQKLK